MYYLILPVVIVLAFIIVSGYVKAPPDMAYIISGMGKNNRILIGRSGIRIPFLQRLDKLYLTQISVDIKTTEDVPTNDFINVKVDAVAKIRIKNDDEGLKLASKNFLNMRPEQIAADLQDTLQGNMREIIGTLSLLAINTDRDSFSDQVMAKASKDMDKLGIEILSCNIQNITDSNNLIVDMGADNTARIKKDASIAKAQADRDVAIASAEADQAANNARVEAETAIAQRNTELELTKHDLKIRSDTKKAEADAAYAIQEQKQQRTIQVATVEAEIARTEREAALREQEVAVAKQTLDAEVRAKADAERYRQQQEAEADLFKRQKEAEAQKYEREQEALAEKTSAEARRFAKEQEAAGISAVGKAEAEAIRAKAVAEAEGIDKKAEAMKKYGDAAIVEMVMAALPEIAKNVAEPLAKVDKITMYGEGNSAKLLQDIVNGTTQVTEGFASGMGLDIKAFLAGILGGKLGSGDPKPPSIIINPPNQPDSGDEGDAAPAIPDGPHDSPMDIPN
jgi:flotillin